MLLLEILGIVLVLVVVFVAILVLVEHFDSRCSYCGKKYEKGYDNRGTPIYTNKHISKDFIPCMSLGGGSDGGDQSSYCTECYEEIFGESPEETGR